jgi:hypothetical protein
VGLSHNTLARYYSMIFSLAQHHKYSITEIENLIPYERDLYVDMLLEFLEQQKQDIENRKT